MFCHKCGTKIPDDAEYCYRCGTKVVYDATDPQRVDPIVPDNEQQQTESTLADSEPLINQILILTNVTPEHKARVIELVQALTGLGLEEASALIKKSPRFLETTPMTLAQVKDVKEAFIQAGVDVCFIDRYGDIVEATIQGKDAEINAHGKDKDGLRCPKCHSSDLIPITETTTDVSGGGYGVGKGCCGWILFGPFGLLCGLCGSGVKTNTKTITSWVCKDCGNKFRNPMDVKAEEKSKQNAEQMATGISTLGGSAILYIVGNLLADNGLELFGIPNWVYITLGVLGAILGILGVLASILDGALTDMDGASELAKKVFSAAVIVSIASFLGGIIFAIMDIRVFWMPAWIYILFGLLGGILFAFLWLLAWMSSASEEELDAFDKKYDPLIQKIVPIVPKLGKDK